MLLTTLQAAMYSDVNVIAGRVLVVQINPQILLGDFDFNT